MDPFIDDVAEGRIDTANPTAEDIERLRLAQLQHRLRLMRAFTLFYGVCGCVLLWNGLTAANAVRQGAWWSAVISGFCMAMMAFGMWMASRARAKLRSEPLP